MKISDMEPYSLMHTQWDVSMATEVLSLFNVMTTSPDSLPLCLSAPRMKAGKITGT